MVDSLKIYEALKTHLTETQAKSVTLAIQEAEIDIAKDVKSVVGSAFAQCATKADLIELRAEMNARFAAVDTKIAEVKAELIRWMFVFWVGQVATTVALVKLLK